MRIRDDYYTAFSEALQVHFRDKDAEPLPCVIENLFRANDAFVKKGDYARFELRLEKQRSAMTDLKILYYISMLAMEQGCILPKQYEQIARQCTNCQNLLGPG